MNTSESILMLHNLGLYSPSQVSYFTYRGLHRRLYSACIMCRLHRTQHGFWICLLAMLHFAKQLPLLATLSRLGVAVMLWNRGPRDTNIPALCSCLLSACDYHREATA